MSLGNLFEHDVCTVTPDQSILDVATLMRDHLIGDVVVVERKDGKTLPIGMLTDRDIVTAGLADRADQILDCKVSDLMSRDIVCLSQDDEIQDVVMRMRDSGVARAPVIDANGSLVGILTSNRIFKYLNSTLASLSEIRSRRKESDRSYRPGGQQGSKSTKAKSSKASKEQRADQQTLQ